jgi:hypothetical protein
MNENALVDGAVMVNFGWEFFIVPNTIIGLSICIPEANINGNIIFPYPLLDAIYLQWFRDRNGQFQHRKGQFQNRNGQF